MFGSFGIGSNPQVYLFVKIALCASVLEQLQ